MASPPMNRTASMVAFVLVAALLAAPLATAEVHEGEVVLAPGDSVEVRIEHDGSAQGLVVYWVTVFWGAPVNVWVVSEEGWSQYHDVDATTFDYDVDGSMQATREAVGFFAKLDAEGTYYVIIENADPEDGGEDSSLYYRVEHDVDDTLDVDPVLILILVIIVVSVAVIIGFDVMVRQGRARRELDEAREADLKRRPQEVPATREPPRPPPGPPPEPPRTYPEEVVKESMKELGHEEEWET